MIERLHPSDVDAIARRIAELLAANTPPRARLVDAAELADLLDVSRAFVYEHATELGAVRLGDGARARLRFDPDRALAARQHRVDPEPEASRPRRRAQTTSTPLLPIRGQETV